MSKNINDASLANLKHFEGKWKHGQTRTIRVPIALADRVLALARQLDKDESLDTAESKIAELEFDRHQHLNSDKTRKSRDTSDTPDAADLLNRLKSNKKSKATLSDVEAILAILKE
ncbi:MAG: hypothetical protein ACRC62_32155 [Microcoleus sp.]